VRQLEPKGGRRGGQVSQLRGGREQVEVRPGDTVMHDKWGEGVVISISGVGADARATVAFEDVGEKHLMLAFAPLKRL
jgi:DNA helicase-2/ATP-dependent DNA helicase PcrA